MPGVQPGWVVAGLKSLSGVKEVERGSVFVLAFGDQ